MRAASTLFIRALWGMYEDGFDRGLITITRGAQEITRLSALEEATTAIAGRPSASISGCSTTRGRR